MGPWDPGTLGPWDPGTLGPWDELDTLSAAPAHTDTAEIRRPLLRHQHTAHELAQVQASPATLVDTNLVLQIVVSVAGILLADISCAPS